MLTPHSQLERLNFPILFLIIVLFGGCSDDDPVRPPSPGVDISGVVRTEAGPPTAGAAVYLGRIPEFFSNAATVVFDSVVTDGSGRYVFDALDEGRYQVYSGVWGHGGEGFSQVSPFSGRLDIPAKSADHVVNLSLLEVAAKGLVAGEVFTDRGFGLVPVDSATVALYRYEGSELVRVDETATQAEGQYALAGVKTGNHIVMATKILDPDAPFPIYLSAESEAFFCDGEGLVRVETLIIEDVMVEKPAVYLYPEQPGRFQVGLEFGPHVRLTASEPEYGTGWDVFVDDVGRIDRTWDYLFYEIAMRGAPLMTEGWCLSGTELSDGLEAITLALGLTPAEQADFLEYWLGRLPRHGCYEIYPVFGSDLDSWVELDITPAPDTTLRFWLFFRGCATARELPAPTIPVIERTGITVVEWGGAVIP